MWLQLMCPLTPSAGDYPPMDKMTLIEKPIAHKPFFERLSLKTVWVWGFLRHTGVTFFWRHRPAVVVPLAQEVRSLARSRRRVAVILVR